VKSVSPSIDQERKGDGDPRPKADLVKELSLVQGIVERKNSIPILSNVLARPER
jgi:hypothetical protein